MMNLNEMENKYGSVEYEGKKYILLQDAYSETNSYNGEVTYTAQAVRDDVNDSEESPVYRITWDVFDDLMEFDDHQNKYVWKDGITEDESCYCDWSKPSEVKQDGTINTENGWIF